MINWREEIKKFVIKKDDGTPGAAPRVQMDVKGMIGQPDLLYAIVMEMGDLILKKHPSIKAIGSHGVGGSFLISPIMLYVYGHWFNVNGFFVRLGPPVNSYDLPIEGRLAKGWRVLIIDTVIKTGNSSLKAYELLRDYGCEVDGIVVIGDLSNGDNACTRAGIKVEALVTL
ncbi:MAG: hypothetical protein C4532_13090 [Candidatus Abyssobacteria bacterium SURF_17]|uniref:Phosphoribosyltransferase domain-containing protein n=1 Tax=Candidatus Abyssobacteria bacterium SURF_17 TaxID=2093361 RepID=A0A419EV53_9BACT|nr:MAG: hypothetical protein C4532_13090 [Candidatus Abyssubacteria bacterium SURF_17]